MKRSLVLALLITGALAADTESASAQVTPRQFQIAVEAGWQTYDQSSALDGAPIGGIKALYWLNRQIGVGAHLNAGRPVTRGDYFPYVRHSFLSNDESNDTTLLYTVNQRVTHLQVGVDGALRYEFGRIAPFVSGSIGYYRMFLDPQELNGLADINGTAFALGGGLELRVAANSGIKVGVSDEIFTDFDRDRFCTNCTGSYRLLQEDRFPNPNPPPPAKKSTVHNLRFILGFNFVPAVIR